jgi:cobalamin synthase
LTLQYLDFFIWWAITISGGIAFLIMVSIYLYINSRIKRKESSRTRANRPRPGKSFVFVWVLIGLLVFYIFSVNIGSTIIFAIGNIIVEFILIVYLVRNRSEKSDEKSVPPS